MAASENALGKLHQQLAEVMSAALDGEELPGYTDEDGEEIPGKTLLPSASVMTAVAKFLKDNEITCAVEEGSEMGELMKKFEKRQQSLRKVNKAEIAGDVAFLGEAH